MTLGAVRRFWLNKQTWLDFAEIVDAWRIFPRIVLGGYAWMVWDMWQWVASKPDLTTQQSVFAGAVIGMGVPLAGLYFGSGRKWGDGGSTGASG